jgi:enamine deaminase RidA (YjgF/YER057c/UK114 family)
VGEGDIAAQAEFIFRRIEQILVDAGASLRDVVETTEYVTTFKDYKLTADVRRRVFGGPPWPAATGVLVAGLIRPGALIETKAVAVLP